MATMNISLPDAMKQWVEQQGRSDQYSNSSDYVRDLIRRDHERALKISHLQTLVIEGFQSGAGKRNMEELKAVAANIAPGS